jgi:hypothetical protein
MRTGLCVAGTLAILAFAATPALAAAPEVASRSVAGVTTFGARLEATVNAGEEAAPETTECHFQYGETAVSEHTVACEQGTPEGTLEGGEQGVSVTVKGLQADTTYHYRVLLKNASGEAEGTGKFTTAAAVEPQIEGESVTAITQTTASFSATINPELQPVTVCEFLFSGAIPATPCAPSAGELGEGGEGVRTGASLTGLSANTEYDYKVLAENGTGPSEVDQTFLTLPNPPAVSTGKEASVTGPTTATISGSVNPGSSGFPTQDDTKYSFQYGTTTGYGHQVPGLLDQAEAEACKIDLEKSEACPSESEAGEGESIKAERSNLVGLEPGRTYHYRIVATNDNDSTDGGLPQTVYGQDATFETPSTPPIISGTSVSNITQSTATITATLQSQGLPTRWELQVGATPGVLQPAGSGDTAGTIPLSVSVGSLSPGTTYYYKLTAINPDGPSEPDEEGSFTTAPAGGSTNQSAPASLPALIPYQTIAELNAKEAKEDKGLPGPVVSKSLTRSQKLSKALKACRKSKSRAKRAKCEATARKRYVPVRKTSKKGSK